MDFITSSYQRTHGRSPRGLGNWAFCPMGKHNQDDYLAHTVFTPHEMTITEAKKWASKQPGIQGHKFIVVLP